MGTMGAKGTLAIDQLSGFRVSSVSNFTGSGGVSFASPIGFAIQRYNESPYQPGPDRTYHATTFWIAPSADIFIIDHLSLGGLIEFVTTSTSVDAPVGGGGTLTQTLPGTNNFTLLPRVGYLIQVSDRFGIWPRGGIGYASRQIVSGDPNNPSRSTFSGALLDFDVGFIFRVTESFFFRVAPEITFSLGASHSDVDNRGIQTPSASASFLQFGGVAGIGVFWDL
jgi:hypothetical protein